MGENASNMRVATGPGLRQVRQPARRRGAAVTTHAESEQKGRLRVRKLGIISFAVFLTLLGCLESGEGDQEQLTPPGTPATVSFEVTGINARVVLVDPTYFDQEVDRPFLGRLPLAADFGEDAGRIAVLSHGLWQAMGGSVQVLGSHVQVGDKRGTVVGIMSPEFVPEDWSIAWVSR
jgi:hypothetical protein